MTVHRPVRELARYRLADRYDQTAGRVFMTGTQALVRIVLDQARRDRAAGLEHGRLRLGLSRLAAGRRRPGAVAERRRWLKSDRIEFLPAVNEDLAATAVLGSQQVETDPDTRGRGRVRACGTARGRASTAPAMR